jgi:hypothetical protein
MDSEIVLSVSAMPFPESRGVVVVPPVGVVVVPPVGVVVVPPGFNVTGGVLETGEFVIGGVVPPGFNVTGGVLETGEFVIGVGLYPAVGSYPVVGVRRTGGLYPVMYLLPIHSRSPVSESGSLKLPVV